jgi:hypothetical protein
VFKNKCQNGKCVLGTTETLDINIHPRLKTYISGAKAAYILQWNDWNILK